MRAKLIDIITQDASKLFRLNEEDLFNLKVDYGLRYLEERFEHDPNIGKMLSSHTNFWTWWREMWAWRDKQLLKNCERKVWGIAYAHYPVLKHTTQVFRLKDRNFKQVMPIMERDTWNFYQDFHRPDKITYYPNYVLINSCIKKVITL